MAGGWRNKAFFNRKSSRQTEGDRKIDSKNQGENCAVTKKIGKIICFDFRFHSKVSVSCVENGFVLSC